MDRGRGALPGFIVGIAIILVGCSVSASPSASPPASDASPTSLAASTLTVPSDEPSAPATATSSPTSQPTTQPTATPASTPPLESITTAWTGPSRVGDPADCSTVSAAIDSAGRQHIAAECGGTVNTFVANADGSWTRTVLAHPAGRLDLVPQLAVRGDVVYVAFERVPAEHGCVGSGPDVAIYVRSQVQPDGDWSAATKLGPAGDYLQSFSVDHGAIRATVVSTAGSGGQYYETVEGTTFQRYPIPDAAGPTSLGIGSDGRARIAYTTDGSLRYAILTDDGFVTSPIGGSIKPTDGEHRSFDSTPVLVLDGGNRAHVVWTRYVEGDCGIFAVALYYATNASGAWKSHLLASGPGEASLQVDDATGRVHILVSTGSGLEYVTAASGAVATSGEWTRTRLVSTPGSSCVLRLDAATGALLVVYLQDGKIYSIATR